MPSLLKSAKIKSLRRLKQIVAESKQRGERIVLANGCFDLIHAGHIRYLQAAKRMGDRLIVAINSDRSVRKIKGVGRPLLPAKERAFILASFWFVDYVTIFNEKNVDKVLETLRPDIHVKGSDYRLETVPERETAKKLGIKVAIVGGPKIRSTSTVIQHIARKLAARKEAESDQEERLVNKSHRMKKIK